jgi:hypothetical protein
MTILPPDGRAVMVVKPRVTLFVFVVPTTLSPTVVYANVMGLVS